MNMSMFSGAGFAVAALLYFVFILGFLVIWIYGFVLFVKLANRGIKALDIYIGKNNGGNNQM